MKKPICTNLKSLVILPTSALLPLIVMLVNTMFERQLADLVIRVIVLTQNQRAFVDDEDYTELMRWKWHCNSHGYAVRTPGGRKNKKSVFMHRQIMSAADATSVVFRDGNPLNCQKENLLVGDSATVQHKRGRLTNKTFSQYKGIFRAKSRRKWFVQIKIAGKAKYLGSYEDEEQAARALMTKQLVGFSENTR